MEPDATLLLHYAAKRDADAFAELTRRYRALVFAVAKRITGSHHDAEDVAQQCFVELAKQADSVRMSVAGWLHAKATSLAKNCVRQQSRQKRREQAISHAEVAADEITWEHLSPRIEMRSSHLFPMSCASRSSCITSTGFLRKKSPRK